MTIQLLSVKGHKIAARLFNPNAENVPLICIHGITSSVEFWTVGQLDWVKRGKQWIALGLPGHFPSEFPAGFKPEDLTPELIAELLWGALDQLIGDQPVVVGGHSTGGFAAVAMAAKKPDRVKGVFSISGFVHGKWTGVLSLLQTFARLGTLGRFLFRTNFRVLASSYWVFMFAARFYAKDVPAMYTCRTLYPTNDRTFPHYQQLDLEAMLAWFSRMPDTDISDWLPKIKVPTLVIHGAADPIVPFKQGKLIAEGVQNGELVSVEGCGHLPMAERTELYEDALDRFWKQLI